MKVGLKAQGQDQNGKLCVQRHGHSSKRSYNRVEKKYETKVRQQGRKACKSDD